MSLAGAQRPQPGGHCCSSRRQPLQYPPPAHIALLAFDRVARRRDLQTYWENILNKVDAISEIPIERFAPASLIRSDKSTRQDLLPGAGLSTTPLNPLDYGMPPNSIPSSRCKLLMLEVVYRIADAGYLNRPFARESALRWSWQSAAAWATLVSTMASALSAAFPVGGSG